MVKQYLGLRGKSLQFAISFVCTTGFLLFGYVLLPSLLRPILPYLLTWPSVADTTKVSSVPSDALVGTKSF